VYIIMYNCRIHVNMYNKHSNAFVVYQSNDVSIQTQKVNNEAHKPMNNVPYQNNWSSFERTHITIA